MRSSTHRLLLLLSVFVLWPGSALQVYKSYNQSQNETQASPATSTIATQDTMASTLKFLTVAARAKHTATVIFVHVSIFWLLKGLNQPYHIMGVHRVLATLDMVGSPSRRCWAAHLRSNISSGSFRMRTYRLRLLHTSN